MCFLFDYVQITRYSVKIMNVKKEPKHNSNFAFLLGNIYFQKLFEGQLQSVFILSVLPSKQMETL